MRSIFLTSGFILFVALVSCNSNTDKTAQATEPASSNFLNSPVPENTANATTTPANSNNAVLPEVKTTAPAAGLNPAHGQPGHNHDIADGAPLNSAAANTPTQTITTPNSQTNKVDIKPTAAPVTAVAPGMNPQHGQPGHRCDIEVGAPLNSAVATKATPQIVAPANTTVNNINVNPPSLPVTSDATTTAPGMNPQHGQPGHRCDIAVGAPLNSKPKQ